MRYFWSELFLSFDLLSGTTRTGRDEEQLDADKSSDELLQGYIQP